MKRGDDLPNLRPAAVKLLRAALEATPTGDPGAVVDAVRRTERGLPRSERIRLMTTVLFIAAQLIGRNGGSVELLAALERASDDDLRVALGLTAAFGSGEAAAR